MDTRPLIGVDASRLAIRQRTGTEQYTAHLLPALLQQPGDERYRFYLNAPVAELASWNQRAEVRAMPFPRLWTHGRLAAELRRQAPDLLFVPAHVLPFPCPTPAVVTIHDLGYLHVPEAHTASARAYLAWSTRWSTAAAKRVIAISEVTKRDLVHHYGVAPNKIDVVYHGLAPRFRPPSSPDEGRETLAALGIRPPYILAVGTVQPRKNYVRLIQAFARLRAEGRDLRLVIVGRTGWLAEATLTEPAASGVATHVLFTGHVPDAAVPLLMGRAALIAVPSLYEGLGLPAIEALACGTPLVYANAAALLEVVDDAGFPCDPRSVNSITHALRWGLTDEAERARRRARGLARASNFTWERTAAATLATLRRALASTRRGTAP